MDPYSPPRIPWETRPKCASSRLLFRKFFLISAVIALQTGINFVRANSVAYYGEENNLIENEARYPQHGIRSDTEINPRGRMYSFGSATKVSLAFLLSFSVVLFLFMRCAQQLIKNPDARLRRLAQGTDDACKAQKSHANTNTRAKKAANTIYKGFLERFKFGDAGSYYQTVDGVSVHVEYTSTGPTDDPGFEPIEFELVFFIRLILEGRSLVETYVFEYSSYHCAINVQFKLQRAEDALPKPKPSEEQEEPERKPPQRKADERKPSATPKAVSDWQKTWDQTSIFGRGAPSGRVVQQQQDLPGTSDPDTDAPRLSLQHKAMMRDLTMKMLGIGSASEHGKTPVTRHQSFSGSSSGSAHSLGQSRWTSRAKSGSFSSADITTRSLSVSADGKSPVSGSADERRGPKRIDVKPLPDPEHGWLSRTLIDAQPGGRHSVASPETTSTEFRLPLTSRGEPWLTRTLQGAPPGGRHSLASPETSSTSSEFPPQSPSPGDPWFTRNPKYAPAGSSHSGSRHSVNSPAPPSARRDVPPSPGYPERPCPPRSLREMSAGWSQSLLDLSLSNAGDLPRPARGVGSPWLARGLGDVPEGLSSSALNLPTQPQRRTEVWQQPISQPRGQGTQRRVPGGDEDGPGRSGLYSPLQQNGRGTPGGQPSSRPPPSKGSERDLGERTLRNLSMQLGGARTREESTTSRPVPRQRPEVDPIIQLTSQLRDTFIQGKPSGGAPLSPQQRPSTAGSMPRPGPPSSGTVRSTPASPLLTRRPAGPGGIPDGTRQRWATPGSTQGQVTTNPQETQEGTGTSPTSADPKKPGEY